MIWRNCGAYFVGGMITVCDETTCFKKNTRMYAIKSTLDAICMYTHAHTHTHTHTRLPLFFLFLENALNFSSKFPDLIPVPYHDVLGYDATLGRDLCPFD